MTRVRMLHFKRQRKDTLQGILMILLSFCSEFIRVYVYQQLFEQRKI